MEFWHAALLGLVEGLTEFIPVSSTGHLILTSHLLRLPSTEFLKTFEIAIQSGAMVAILVLYGRKFLVEPGIAIRVAIAFIPTVIIGLVVHKYAKAFLDNPKLVLISLLVGGLVLLALEAFHNESRSRVKSLSGITFGQAFGIGVCQTLAFVPGVSRSGATIGGALVAGLDRKTGMEFSFLLAAPTLLAATGFDLIQTSPSFSQHEWELLACGLLVSTVVALVTVRFFLDFVSRFGFRVFGIYRIILALALWSTLS